MFKHFTTSDLVMIAIALDEEDQRNVQWIWVHDIEGEYVTLYKQLTDHENIYFLSISVWQKLNLMYFYQKLNLQ